MSGTRLLTWQYRYERTALTNDLQANVQAARRTDFDDGCIVGNILPHVRQQNQTDRYPSGGAVRQAH